ncbi:MAG: hypothetical protein AAF921_19280 [Cyanobacteria bacterium P01_D01_bin.44]
MAKFLVLIDKAGRLTNISNNLHASFSKSVGAFEVICYVVATLVAIKFGNLICDESETLTEPEMPSRPTLNLTTIKLYKLHQKPVAHISDIPFAVPTSIKCYTLRGRWVVRLEALAEVATVIA